MIFELPAASTVQPHVRSASVCIIVCTRNRAESLRETLASIGTCSLPDDLSAEILIIDNGSTDETEMVARGCQVNSVPVRCISEPHRGLSRARNLAISSTTADILLWTDDDVRVPQNWIHGMCSPILRGEGDAVMGGVCLAGQLKRPWLSPLMETWLACTEHIDSRSLRLVGANMAVASRVFTEIGGFCEKLGAGAVGFGEDCDLSRRLQDAGFGIVDGRSCAVVHHPDEARVTRNGFLEAATQHGQSIAHTAQWVTTRHCAAALAMYGKCRFDAIVARVKARIRCIPLTDQELIAHRNAALWRAILWGTEYDNS